MGSEISKTQMTKVIKDVLKSNGMAVKETTAWSYVQILAKVSPWFIEEGLLKVPQWDLHKQDLIATEKQGAPLPKGTFPMWQFVAGETRGPGLRHMRLKMVTGREQTAS